MSARPATLALAVVLVALIGTGLAVVGVLLLALWVGLVAFLAGGVHGFVAVLGLTGIAAAAVTYAAAAGLWLGRPTVWAASLVIAGAAVIGAVVAIATSGAQAPSLAGLALGGAAGVLLVAPETRLAARV
jgi:hypothetical protein